MNLREYKVLFIVVTFVVSLLVASPALSRLLVYPRTDFFTEFGLLGSNNMAEGYPFNISSGHSFTIYINVTNHLGYFAYYLVEVKLLNESQQGPNAIKTFTPSPMPSLYNISVFVGDEASWEEPFVFSFNYGLNKTALQVNYNNMTLNDVTFGNTWLNLNGYTTSWNATRRMFPSNLVFELWIFNSATNGFQYHQRFLNMWLNMTG